MKTARHIGGSASGLPAEPAGDLVQALAGKQASRDCAVADRTRRVVLTSYGVLEEQRAGRRRSRALALASLVMAFFIFGPLLWHLAEELIAGERFGDMATQTSLWACIICPALLAAVLVAGWPRRKP